MIFRNGVQLRQKLLFCLMLLGVGLIPGMIFSRVLVFEDVFIPLLYGSILISVVVTYHVAVLLIHSNLKNKWITLASIILGIPACSIIIIIEGLPSTAHIFLSYPHEMTVTVEYKSSSYQSTDCSGGINLLEFDYLLSNRVCGIGPDVWRNLNPGDQLVLPGSKSLFGFKYEKN